MSFREHIRQHPFLRLLLPLATGIVSARFFFTALHFQYLLICTGLLGICLFTFHSGLRKSFAYRAVFGLFVFLFCFGMGNYRYKVVEKAMQISKIDSSFLFVAKLVQSPIEKPNSYHTVAVIQPLNDKASTAKESAKAILYFQKDSLSKHLTPGDEILINSRIQQVANKGNPYEFDYAAYLKTQHILYSSYLQSSSWHKLKQQEKFSLTTTAAKWRNQLLDCYRKNGISGESFDILAALTLGYKATLDPEMKQAWANAGAMHVLAVSGLHVGIIYLIMSFFLGRLLRYKWGSYVRGMLLLLTLWMYALLTGMSPSVMRAACMFSFIVFGEMLQRRGSIFNSLAASAFFLLLFDPFLLFTVGFQFSYLAVAGIVFFQPKFDQLVYIKNPLLNKFWQLTTVAIAAQIATFPLGIYYFHQFPTYFLLSGYLVISMAGILIYLSALLLLLSPFGIAHYLGWLLQNMVEVMNWGVVAIQDLPKSVIHGLVFTNYQVLLLYLLLFSLIFVIVLRRKKAVFVVLIVLIALQIPKLTKKIKKPEREMVVFNAGKNTLLAFSEGSRVLFLVNEELRIAERERLVQPYLLHKNAKEIQWDTLQPTDSRLVGDYTILILGEKLKNVEDLLTNVNTDCILFRNKSLQSKGFTTNNLSATQLVIDASVPYYDRKKNLPKLKKQKIPFHDVLKDGAFICSYSLLK